MFYYITVNIENGYVSCHKTTADISREFNLSENIITTAIQHEYLISKNGGCSNVCQVYTIPGDIPPDW